jgi:hypothetical protein
MLSAERADGDGALRASHCNGILSAALQQVPRSRSSSGRRNNLHRWCAAPAFCRELLSEAVAGNAMAERRRAAALFYSALSYRFRSARVLVPLALRFGAAAFARAAALLLKISLSQ